MRARARTHTRTQRLRSDSCSVCARKRPDLAGYSLEKVLKSTQKALKQCSSSAPKSTQKALKKPSRAAADRPTESERLPGVIGVDPGPDAVGHVRVGHVDPALYGPTQVCSLRRAAKCLKVIKKCSKSAQIRTSGAPLKCLALSGAFWSFLELSGAFWRFLAPPSSPVRGGSLRRRGHSAALPFRQTRLLPPAEKNH